MRAIPRRTLFVLACVAMLLLGAAQAPVRLSGIEVEPTVAGAVFRYRDWALSVSQHSAVISYLGISPLEDELRPARVELKLPVGSELPPPVAEEELPRSIAVSVKTARGMARALMEDARVLKAYVDESVLADLRGITHGRFGVQAAGARERLDLQVAEGFCGDGRCVRLELSQGRFRVRALITRREWEISGEMWKLETPPHSRWMDIARGVRETTQPVLPDPRLRIRRLADGRIIATESSWSADALGSPYEVAREYLRKVQAVMDAEQVDSGDFVREELARVLAELAPPPDVFICETAGGGDE